MKKGLVKLKKALWKSFIGMLAGFMILTGMDSSITNLYAIDASTNITFTVSAVENTNQSEGNTLSEVQSGQEFFLAIAYSFASTGAGGSSYTYSNGTFQIHLPDKVVVDIEELEQQVASSVFNYYDLDQDNYLTLSTGDVTIPANTGVMYIKMHYKNLETPDGYGKNVSEQFNDMKYTGIMTDANGNSQKMDPINVDNVSVVNKANQTWSIYKSIEKQNNDDYVIKDDHYQVEYKLHLSAGDVEHATADRYGRLACDPFELKDLLPTLTDGTIKNGKIVGYPKNGGAAKVSIIVNKGDASQKTLEEGKDYTINKNADGSINSINFTYINQSGDTDFLDAGTPISTDYFITASYPRDAYEIASNEEDFSAYHLINNAQLTYKPLGKEEQTVKSNAPVDLGWSEENPNTYSLTIQKQVKVASNDTLTGVKGTLDFTKDMQDAYYQYSNNKVKFGLYKDKNGTRPAMNADGTDKIGTNVAVDENGEVTFNGLIAGTYYLIEDETIDGFQTVATKKVVISKDGTIKIDGDVVNGEYKIVNTTDKDGYGYVAFWKRGNNAAGDVGYLKDVEFTLTSATDKNVTYTAVSDETGLVLFKGVKAGNYTLTEVEKADGEFKPLDEEYIVEVIGNKINYPTTKTGNSLKEFEDKPYILNESTKGSVRIIKVDANDLNKKLKGAEFIAYGPYDNEQDIASFKEPTNEDLIHTIASEFTDGIKYFALDSGYYVIKEKTAPKNYVLSNELQSVEIKQGQTSEVTFTNVEYGGLKIKKTGQLSSTLTFQVPLANAEFTVYTDASATKVAKDKDGKDAVLISKINQGNATSNTVYLAPGTYYLKETKTPEGYQISTAIIEAVVNSGVDNATELTITNIADQLGQLKITKKDASTNNVIQESVKFEIYKADDTEFKTVIETISTVNGVATSSFLPVGDYVIKEVSAPNGYSSLGTGAIYKSIDDNGVAQLTGNGIRINKNTIVELAIENEPLVSYQVKKVDETTNAVLSGVEFTLYKSKDDAENKKNGNKFTSDSNGLLTFTNLEPNTKYYYRETAVKNNDYILDDTICSFTSPNKDSNYAQGNIPTLTNLQYGTFTMNKTLKWYDSSITKLGNIKFNYYPKLSDDAKADKKSAGSNVKSKTTNNQGSFTSDKLVPGDYWVEEELTASQKDQYVQLAPVVVTVKAKNTSEVTNVNIENTYKDGKLKIKKVDSLANANIQYARFNIYQYNETYTSASEYLEAGTPYKEMNTSASGEIEVVLPAGQYVLFEVEPTASNVKDNFGYVVDSTLREFVIESGKLTSTFYGDNSIKNTPKGRFKLDKFESWNKKDDGTYEYNFRQEVTFKIYSDESCSEDSFVAQMKSSVNGSVYSPYLEAGTYWVKEEVDETEYESVAVQKVVVEAGQNHGVKVINDKFNEDNPNSNADVAFHNIPKKSKIRITKIDAETLVKLNGAEFEVYEVVSAGNEGAIAITNANNETVYVKKYSNTKAITGTADIDDDKKADAGEAFTVILEAGTYYLKEVKEPDGYEMITQWTGPISVSAGNISHVTVENYKPISVGAKKVDDANNKVSGALLALFKDQASADAAINALKVEGSDASKAYIAKVKEAKNWEELGIIATATSNAQGTFKFNGLNPSATYYAVEIEVGSDYTRDPSVHIVKVINSNGSYILVNADNSSEFILQNNRKGNIQVKKVVTLSNVEYAIDGVKFNIYRADSQSDDQDLSFSGNSLGEYTTGTYQSGDNGTFLTGALEPGWYIISENTSGQPDMIGTPTGITNWKVKVDVGQINKTYFTTPIKNEAKLGQFAIKKGSSFENETNISLNATFLLEVKGNDGSWTPVTSEGKKGVISVSKNNVYKSGYLSPGTYHLIEQSTDANYTVDPTPIEFEIVAGKITAADVNNEFKAVDEYNNAYTILNAKKGSISLTKKGHVLTSEDYVALSGVTFKVYKSTGNYDEDIKQNVLVTASTNQAGELSITGLDAGKYWIVESSVDELSTSLVRINGANGYTATFVKEVSVEAGKDTHVTSEGKDFVANESSYGKIKITKADYYEQDKLLSGVEFEIYQKDGESKRVVQTISTNDQGTFISKALPAGDYYIKETKTIDDYLLNDTEYGPYVVVAGQLTEGNNNVENAPSIIFNKGKTFVKIVKKDSITDQEISNADLSRASFAIYNSRTDAENSSNAIETINGSKLTFDTALKPETTYYIRELSAPNGYVLSDEIFEVTTGTQAMSTAQIVIKNSPYGSLTVEKQAVWNLPGEDNKEHLPLAEVEFKLYKYAQNAEHHLGDIVSSGTKTNAAGKITFRNLAAGKYVLVEVAPEGFTKLDNPYFEVTIEEGKENAIYTNDNAIINYPSLGKFVFTKTSINVEGNTITPVAIDGDKVVNTTFKLQKFDNSKYVDVEDGYDKIHPDAKGDYSSGMLEPGKYRLIETQAPDGYAKLSEPIDFEIIAAQITRVSNNDDTKTIVNESLGNVKITKYSDSYQYDETSTKEVLSDVEFTLYKGANDKVSDETKVKSVKTDNDGVALWTQLEPGVYTIKETSTIEGYAKNDYWYEVTVNANESSVKTYVPNDSNDPAYGNDGNIYNVSEAGRIVVFKKDTKDKALANALFSVYELNTSSQKGKLVSTIKTDENGYGASGLISADAIGTNYLVVETKAPDGYTLDDQYGMIETVVTVKPLQNSEIIINNATLNDQSSNFATFINTSKDNYKESKFIVNKGIASVSGSTDINGINTELYKNQYNPLTASVSEDDTRSLLESDLNATFKIYGYALGNNKIDTERVIVTDENIQMQYLENEKYVNEVLSEDAYKINSITVHKSYIYDDVSSEITAEVQYKQFNDQNWTTFETIENVQKLTDVGQVLDVSKLNAVHFRVIYKGTNKNFYSDGIEFNATFVQRESNASLHEIRRITNTANVEYEYAVKDETGKTIKTTLEPKNTQTVDINLPLLQASTPKVNIDITVDGDRTSFNPGDQVLYTIKANNTSYNAEQLFKDPIVSFDLPVGLSLDDLYPNLDAQFLVLYGDDPNNGKTIDWSKIRVVESDTTAKQVDDTGNIIDTDVATKKITLFFNGVTIEKDKSLYIRFATHISRGSISVNNLIAPAYLNSSSKVPLSAENPYGNSFDATSVGGQMVKDEKLDEIIDGAGQTVESDVARYVFSQTPISVAEISELTIYKQVKGHLDDEYKEVGQTAMTVPKGDIDYRITVKNGSNSTNAVAKARVIDILPFYGDTLVNRNSEVGTVTERNTQILSAPVLNENSIKVYDSNSNLIDSKYVTIYYCLDPSASWSKETREQNSREDDLPMIYQTMSDVEWTSANTNRKWVTSLVGVSLEQVSAIGVEVDFAQSTLDKGKDFVIEFSMTAPDFTTEQIAEVENNYWYNSAMVAVKREGYNDSADIQTSNRTENDPVRVGVSLPKGSIGDYVFIDRNSDGLQDETDIALSGVKVWLHTYKKTAENDKPVKINSRYVLTDQQGYYLFDGLDCNNPIDGADPNSNDPSDFVNGSIYSYVLQFETPVDESYYAYEPTYRYIGDDKASDSNIDDNGYTDFVTLTVSKDVDGNLIGEDNMTIDAGYRSMAALGDYVWIDDNANGIQDENEKGLEGVKVNLYQIDEVKNHHFIKTTFTDADGKYLFEALNEGDYVVEFDISEIDSKGYSEYQFTKSLTDEESNEVNSDAKHFATSNKIAATDEIHLGYRQVDLSWDAGVIYYSALEGYAFEDRNYDDLHTDQEADIPLTETVVELYEVIDGVTQEQPLRSTKVDSDGKYLFDRLTAGSYQVKFIFPEGYEIVNGNVGNNDTIDSDISLETELNSGYTEIINVPVNAITSHWDGGARRYSSLGDYVWHDANKDGIQDDDEDAIENVEVYLLRKMPNEDYWEEIGQTNTDENGKYRFDHLQGSTYTGIEYKVIFNLSPSTPITTPLNGDPEIDSNALPEYIFGWGYPTDVIDLAYASEDMTWDAGIIETSGSVGDYVWFDTNKNGIQDEIGTGIGDVLVVLEKNETDNMDQNGWVEVNRTTTNSSGYYRFDDLQAGYYRVKFYLPNSYVTLPIQGNDAAKDSDGMQRDGDWAVSRPFYLEEGGFDMTWDCGIYDGNPPGTRTGDTSHTRKYQWLFAGSLLACAIMLNRRKSISK